MERDSFDVFLAAQRRRIRGKLRIIHERLDRRRLEARRAELRDAYTLTRRGYTYGGVSRQAETEES